MITAGGPQIVPRQPASLHRLWGAADVFAVIRLTAVQPRVAAAEASKGPSRPPSGGSLTWPGWPCCRMGGLRRSEAAALTWRDVQRPHHSHPLQDRRRGPGRGGGHHSRRHAGALDAFRPEVVGSDQRVFGISVSQIARRGKVTAKAAGLADWD